MEKFKVGDKVVCIPGFTREGDGGFGYKEGEIFIIKKITSSENICWGAKDGNGVYPVALRLAIEEEIRTGEAQILSNYEIY